MEAIRVKDKEWQLAGVHYVRTEAMCNGFGVSLEMEFGEDKAGDEYILVLDGIHPVPSLGNSFIGLIKGTSLAFVCAVVEMTAAGKIIAGRTYRYFEVYVSLAIIYWIITIIVEQGIKLIEKKIRIPENAPAIQTDEGVLNQ